MDCKLSHMDLGFQHVDSGQIFTMLTKVNVASLIFEVV